MKTGNKFLKVYKAPAKLFMSNCMTIRMTILWPLWNSRYLGSKDF